MLAERFDGMILALRSPLRGRPHFAFISVILLGHAGLIHLMMQRIHDRDVDGQVDFSALPIYVLPLLAPEVVEVSRARAAPPVAMRPPPPRSIEPPVSAAISEPAVPPDTSAQGTATPVPDWAHE